MNPFRKLVGLTMKRPESPSESGTRRIEFPRALIPEGDEEETKTRCPACRGEMFVHFRLVQPGVVQGDQCVYCEGQGLVTASRARAYETNR